MINTQTIKVWSKHQHQQQRQVYNDDDDDAQIPQRKLKTGGDNDNNDNSISCCCCCCCSPPPFTYLLKTIKTTTDGMRTQSLMQHLVVFLETRTLGREKTDGRIVSGREGMPCRYSLQPAAESRPCFCPFFFFFPNSF